MTTLKSTKNLILAILLAPLFFCACSSDEDIDEVQEKQIIVLFSPGGLGDNGYNDQILRGLQSVHWQHPEGRMLLYSPTTMEEAEQIFAGLMSRDNLSMPCLMVLASNEYEDMAYRHLTAHDYDTKNKNILLFESCNPHHLGEGEALKADQPLYTFQIQMYGASYLAGLTAAEQGIKKPLILLAHAGDEVIRSAGDGFRDGFRDATGTDADVQYLSNDWHGFTMSQVAYENMPAASERYDFVFPVAGGTNLGIYRYLREHPEGPLTIGVDVDQSPYTANIMGSLVKHIDSVIIDYVTNWLEGREDFDPHPIYGLESGYINWQLSAFYTNSFSPMIPQWLPTAIAKEKEYLQGQTH